MDNKKRDDYSNKVSELDVPSSRPPNGSKPGGLHIPVSSITNNPAISIIAYCIASISMTVINKYCVSNSEWNMSFFFLAFQSIVSIVAIQACKSIGIVKELGRFDKEKAKSWLSVSLLLVGMIYTGAKALQFLSVPVYTIFKNLSIIVIAYGEVLWFSGSVTTSALFSFGLMVLSSAVAAWADVQHALTSLSGNSLNLEEDTNAAANMSTLNAGYAWMALNIFSSAAYALGMRKVIKKMNDWESMFYKTLLTIPVLVILTLLLEDWSSENLTKNFPIATRNSQILGMVYSGLGTIFISYASAWCIRVTSSTTYSMVGALNKLPIAVSGLVFFDAPVTFGSVSAIFIGFVSGIVYAWAKVRQRAQAKMTLPTQQPVASASIQSNLDAKSSRY